MADSPSSYELALDVIRNAELVHPDGPLLESFLENAADSDKAASQMMQRVSRDENKLSGLTEFLRDWKLVTCECRIRLNPRCLLCEDMNQELMIVQSPIICGISHVFKSMTRTLLQEYRKGMAGNAV